MKRFANITKKYMPLYICILLFALCASICGLVKTYFLSVIIDDVIQLRDIAILKNIVILLIILFVLEQLISYAVGYMNVYITQNISITLRKNVLNKISKIKLKYIYDNRSGNFIINFTEDINIISNCLCNYFLTIINSFITVVITVLFLIIINVKLAFISLIVVTIQVLISIFLAKITKKNQQDILENSAKHIGIIKQITGQIKYIRSYRNENKTFDNYNKCSNEISRLNFVAFLLGYIYRNINAFISFVGSMIIFIIGVILVYNGTISIGILFAFDSITGILYGNISNIVSIFTGLYRASVSFLRVNTLFDMEDEDDGIEEISGNIEEIIFDNVDFKYKDITILNNLQCKMEKGNTYVVVGKSGIGKSTMFNLLIKFYKIDNGCIYINNTPLDIVKTSSLRDKVTIVYQDGCIIDGATIYENICYGNDVDNEKFQEVVKACGINLFVDKLENKYDTIIEENGTNLSGGEKQRIYIARSLVRSSDIYIYDEAFSQIDINLENKIISYIREKFKEKILIIVTHDLNVIQENDKVISLDASKGVDTFEKNGFGS